jgi:hypothetical protein
LNGTNRASLTSVYTDNAATGVTWLNDYYPCAVTVTDGDPPYQSNGLFSGDQDIFGDYFCAGAAGTGATLNTSPNFAGAGSNLAVMQMAQPNVFKSSTPNTNEEMFAETFAYLSGNVPANDWPSTECTYWMLNYLLYEGTVYTDFEVAYILSVDDTYSQLFVDPPFLSCPAN